MNAPQDEGDAPPGPVREWGAEQLEQLARLTQAALSGSGPPSDAVAADDLESLCFGPGSRDPGGPLGETVVLGAGSEAGTALGAVVVSVRRASPDAAPEGLLQLLVVHPSRRRRGLARLLVTAAEEWARSEGATVVQVGGAAPLYLFTGVDARWTDAICCFEALGYERARVELDLVCPTRSSTRRATPPGVTIERLVSEDDLVALAAWAERSWPAWRTEFTRAAEAGTLLVARDDRSGEVLGAAAHSVGRLGVIGPVAVTPGRLQGGIGTALMTAVLAELSAAGLDRAEIAWVSTVRFYVRSCGARVGRTSLVLRRAVAPPPAGIASTP